MLDERRQILLIYHLLIYLKNIQTINHQISTINKDFFVFTKFKLTLIFLCFFSQLSAQETLFSPSLDAAQLLDQPTLTRFEEFRSLANNAEIQLAQIQPIGDITYEENSESYFHLTFGTLQNHKFKIVEAKIHGENSLYQYAQSINYDLDGVDLFQWMTPDGMVGVLNIDQSEYIFYSLNDDFAVVFQPKHDPNITQIDDVDGGELSSSPCVMSSGACTIDILFLYKDNSENTFAPIPPAMQAYTSVGRTNSAFIRSRIQHRVSIAGIFDIPENTFPDGTCSQELSALRGEGENLHSLVYFRKQLTRPDVVVFLSSSALQPLPSDNSVGIAFSPATVGANYAVVNLAYNLWFKVFEHEVGHCLNAGHEEIAFVQPGTPPGCAHQLTYMVPPFATPKQAETILWVNGGGGKINNYSNPDVSYILAPTGTDTRNNACVMQNDGCRVSDLSEFIFIPSPTACMLKISGFRNCNKILLAASFMDVNFVHCVNDGIDWEFSIDGINFQRVDPAKVLWDITETVSLTNLSAPQIVIRATVFVGLTPTSTVMGNFLSPCPSRLSEAQKLSQVLFQDDSTEFFVFPNPCVDKLTISNSLNAASYNLYSENGIVLKHDFLHSGLNQIQVSMLPEGKYQLCLESQMQSRCKNFVKFNK